MRKVLILAAALFAMSSVSWATPCTTLGSLTGTGCSVSGNVFSSLTSTLSSTLGLSPTSGGGFSVALDLSALANTSNSLNFTITAPAGFNITDLSVDITGGAGATLSLSGNNGLSLTATSGGGVMNPTFSGVGSLNLTGTLDVSAGATGTATLTITPSETSTSSVVPEPGTFSLLGLGILGLALAWGVKTHGA